MTAEEIEFAVLAFLRHHMDLDRDIKKGALFDLADIEADRNEYNQVVDQLTSQGFLKKYNQETNTSLKITPAGEARLLVLKGKRGMLDEVEKLDMILRYLYDRRNEAKEYEIREILQDLEIHTSVKEAFRLANRLAEVGVADITRMQAGHFLQISSPGIEYCQKRSFTQSNRSIISMQNFSGNFFNSQLMTAGGSVNNSSQQMGANDEVANLIQRIREVLRQEAEEEQRQDLEEYLQDVEKKVHNREKVPKLQWNALLQNSANLASTGTLMLELAQLLGFVPKT